MSSSREAFSKAAEWKQHPAELNRAVTANPHTPKAIESRLRRAGLDPLKIYADTGPTNSKPVLIPGVKSEWFNRIVETTIIHWAEYHQYPTLAELKQYCANIPSRAVAVVYEHDDFLSVLRRRGLPSIEDAVSDRETGIRQSYLLSEALSSRQLLALSVMTDVTTRATAKTKLARIDVTPDEWQNWLRNPKFRAKFEMLARETFLRAQASVDIQVASGALDGKLDFIKYYNEITGRHDPKNQAKQDVSQVLQKVVEIILRNVTDRETLERINTELQMELAALDI